jgi:hypothetical protein
MASSYSMGSFLELFVAKNLFQGWLLLVLMTLKENLQNG